MAAGTGRQRHAHQWCAPSGVRRDRPARPSRPHVHHDSSGCAQVSEPTAEALSRKQSAGISKTCPEKAHPSARGTLETTRPPANRSPKYRLKPSRKTSPKGHRALPIPNQTNLPKNLTFQKTQQIILSFQPLIEPRSMTSFESAPVSPHLLACNDEIPPFGSKRGWSCKTSPFEFRRRKQRRSPT